MSEGTKIDDGGPAFPLIPPIDETGRTAVGYPYPDEGMTLRDWFAGQAIMGLATESLSVSERHDRAIRAYAIADAMIAARKTMSGGS